jgi:carbon storage regulator
MLVLTRKKNETVVVGDNVEITVVEIRDDKVRLGFDAPADVPVHRLEVYEAIQKQNANG